MKANKLFNEGITIFLKNISQVILIENPWTGLLILLALFLVDVRIGLAMTIANLSSMGVSNFWPGLNKDKIGSGLMGFSAVLVGIASATYFASPLSFILAFFGGIFAVPVTIFIDSIFEKFSLPGLTFPFILLTWLLITIASQVEAISMLASGDSQTIPETLRLANYFSGTIKGFGEIFLLDHFFASLLIFLGILLDKWQRIYYILFTFTIVIILSTLLQVDVMDFTLGLYTYNALLTALAVDNLAIHHKYKWLSLTFGVTMSVLIDLSLASILAVFDLPVLTLSFVLATWFILTIDKKFSVNENKT